MVYLIPSQETPSSFFINFTPFLAIWGHFIILMLQFKMAFPNVPSGGVTEISLTSYINFGELRC